MASGAGAIKHNHTTCCGCFGARREKIEMKSPLEIRTPYPLERSTKRITEKDIVEFNKMVKADGSEVEKGYDQAGGETSSTEEEVKTVEIVFKKIHGSKEEKK